MVFNELNQSILDISEESFPLRSFPSGFSFILLYYFTHFAPSQLQPNYSFLLFPGETIEAKTHEDVTMLFSDIVGFTSICSTATPMMVINMLQNLYNQFDVFCGHIDVYKVSLVLLCSF